MNDVALDVNVAIDSLTTAAMQTLECSLIVTVAVEATSEAAAQTYDSVVSDTCNVVEELPLHQIEPPEEHGTCMVVLVEPITQITP